MKRTEVGPRKEVESPTLQLDTWECDWKNEHTGVEWACDDRLSKLFDLPKKGRRIRLVAKSVADKYTYRVEFDACGIMMKPVKALFLFRALDRWLRKQVKAGRSNIGVYIL